MRLRTKVTCLILCLIPIVYLVLGLLVPCGRIALYCKLGGLLGLFMLPYSFLALSIYRSEIIFFILGLIQFPTYVLLWYLLRRVTDHGYLLAVVMTALHCAIAVICFMLPIALKVT
jgi:hypothetical protein